jgi:hypothetical protein
MPYPDSMLPCFAAFGEQTSTQLRDRFQPALTHSLIGEYVDRLIDSSLGSNWTRLYDSVRFFTMSWKLTNQYHLPVSILFAVNFMMIVILTARTHPEPAWSV